MQKEKCYTTKVTRNLVDDSLDVMSGKLPDLFAKKDGSRVTTRADWENHRKEMLTEMVDLCYGGMPPKPEIFRVQWLNSKTYRIIAGTEKATVSFELRLTMPPVQKEKYPVLLTGDACWEYLTEEIAQEILSRGFILARFNRCMLAEDVFSFDRSQGVYPAYPELKFGAISAWAWGYMRCVDALETMEFVDMEEIAIAGHSRGGKATLLAGAWDERIKYVQSNASGTFGSACFRYAQVENIEVENPLDRVSESVGHMLGYGVSYGSIGFWFGEKMAEYRGREQDLPFDAHFLEAAVAPRWLLETESADDFWCNPRGTYITYRAAKEAFRFLGVEEHIASSYRYGPHAHGLPDYTKFLDFIAAAQRNEPFLADNADQFYGKLPKHYDWEAPECME